MLTLIEGGHVFRPEAVGSPSILFVNERIEKIGRVSRRALDELGCEYDVIDAEDCYVTPGIIDPHQHLLGRSGEGSLALQSPMLFLTEIIRAGITTVVGTLGVDTTMKTLPGLLARVKALTEEGISARMWSGGYNIPPVTITGSIRTDMLFIDECVGYGEVAISDERSLQTSMDELARHVMDAHIGGLLSGKAGLTHFHVGDGRNRLEPLRELLENYEIKPDFLYPTHIGRTPEVIAEAVGLAREGCYVDIDVVERDLAKTSRIYLQSGGPPDRLTVSSDSDSSTPDILYDQLCGLVVKQKMPLELMLSFVTSNTAKALKLDQKGRLDEGKDADILVLRRGSLEIVEVIARGKRMVRDGSVVVREKFLEESSRDVTLTGARFDPSTAGQLSDSHRAGNRSTGN
ncbi:MAG TPA: amidohydrolase family protein [Gemmatimonadaceae bacterium]|nr:amidohydrolase family protein [Gemmatimonadaceae bacterium]